MTPAARLARPRRWPGVVAWTVWALTMVAWPVVPWLDQLLRQAGRPDLTQWDARPAVAVAAAATVEVVLASRRPQHPVGWLLLAQVVSLLANGAAAQYLAWGLLPGGPLPATRAVAVLYPCQRQRGAAPARLRAAVDPDREVALAWLALVGQGHGRRAATAGDGGDLGTRAGRPLRPGAR